MPANAETLDSNAIVMVTHKWGELEHTHSPKPLNGPQNGSAASKEVLLLLLLGPTPQLHALKQTFGEREREIRTHCAMGTRMQEAKKQNVQGLCTTVLDAHALNEREKAQSGVRLMVGMVVVGVIIGRNITLCH